MIRCALPGVAALALALGACAFGDTTAGAEGPPLRGASAPLDGGVTDGGALDATDGADGSHAGDATASNDAPTDATTDATTDTLVVPGTPDALTTGPEDAPGPAPTDTEDASWIASAAHVRVEPAAGLTVQWVPAGDLDAHDTHMADFSLGFHTGLGLHDVDADGDLDLFVGASVVPTGDPACVYRNDSTPGDIRFTRVDGWCLPGDVPVTSVAFLPDATRGATRMLLTGRDVYGIATLTDTLMWAPFEPARIDAAESCDAAPNALFDADLDGDLEAWIGCHGGLSRMTGGIQRAFDFVLDLEAATPTTVDVPDLPELSEASITLATAVIDLDGDGLLDVVAVVDTLSTLRARNTLMPPGGTRIRCAPDAPCAWQARRLFDNVEAWGSFMGFTPWRFGDREVVYLTDFGPNRVVDLAAEERVDTARAIGASLWWQGFIAFSWSAIPGDFDGDGDDDLYVTQGSLPPLQSEHFARHYDAILVQSEGRMTPFSLGVGIPRHVDAEPDTRGYGRSHRGGWRADLDGDGYLDLVLGAWEGAPRIATLRADDGPSWCTLVPRPRYVPTWGYGDHVIGPDGILERARVQGQTRFAVPTSLVTRHREAHLRFASGATVPWSCAPGQRVEVVEPEWLSLRRTDPTTLTVHVTDLGGWRDGTPIDVAVRRPDGEVSVRTGGVVGDELAVDAPADAAVMLRIDGRWVGRWFPAVSR